MSENKRYWDLLKRPPQDALKNIGGGRLKGMTDINPQWRFEAMTDVFGPCGDGWKYSINRIWREDGSDGEVFAFAEVMLYAGGDAIPGIGGSKLVSKEKDYLYNNDEAYKMAVTDALSVAMKMLGVGADVYRGRWDGSKYKDDEKPIKPVGKMAEFKDYLAKASDMEKLQKLAAWAGRHDWGGATDEVELSLEAKGKELAEAQNVG